LKGADTTVPEYWPTVLQFLQFASRGISPNLQAGLGRLVITNNGGYPSFGTIKDKEVFLDGGELGNTRFERCRIIFTARETKMRGVSFADCTFEFPAAEFPSSYLKSVGQTMLASDLKNVLIASP
jgi:hypothetical protein